MLEYKSISEMHYDATIDYKILMDKEYTVKEFINEVLKDTKQFGIIGIENGNSIMGSPICEYRYGRVENKLPYNLMCKRVISCKAKGGYGCMNFILKTV